MTTRIKWFSGDLSPHALEEDKNGIPMVAYWNTKGDHPVSAKKLVDKFVVEVTYKGDQDNE